ncbi:MAG TPA: type VI secretion system baseplate subunit TssK, partial [Nannocystis sp.]
MTIATASRPLWSEGMLMCPQHMQQQDLYHEQHVHARLQALSATPWGVTSVQFDTSALKAGTVQLNGFRGVLPDGTPAHFDALSPLRPPSRAVGPHFPAKQESLGVYLGLPLMREGVANYALSSDASAAQRFRGVVRRVFDLTLARNERELQVSEPALVLLFDGEQHKDHAILKIGEIRHDQAGGYALAESFIAPALAISAAPHLVA